VNLSVGQNFREGYEESVGEDEQSIHPAVASLCRQAAKLAREIWSVQRICQSQGTNWKRTRQGMNVFNKSIRFLDHNSGRILPLMNQFQLNDLDRINGCLTRVSDAIRQETAAQRKLRAEIERSLRL
jgi:hypothetical protein